MVESPVEQISETLAKALDGQTKYSRDCNLTGEYLASLIMPTVSAALTAARIEGEKAGMERAIERLEKRAEDSITHSAEQQIRWDIKALYDLIAKELPQ